MFSTVYTLNLAANTKTANLLAGDINEFVAQVAQINIYAVSSAVGVRVSVMADSDIAVDDKEILPIGTTLDKSQHLLDSFTVYAGTRLSISLRETAGVATTDILTGIEVIPL